MGPCIPKVSCLGQSLSPSSSSQGSLPKRIFFVLLALTASCELLRFHPVLPVIERGRINKEGGREEIPSCHLCMKRHCHGYTVLGCS